MNGQRLKRALKKVWQRNEDERWIYGLMGKIKDGVPVFDVEGRAGYVYVRIRNQNGAQTSPPARNDPGVAHSENLPVRMRMEGTTLVIDSEVRREDLATTPAPPGSGVPVHIHDTRYFTEAEHINVSAGAADAGKPIKLNASGEVDPTMIDLTGVDIGAVIHAAAVETTPLDADETAILDSGASFALKRITWTTIKAFLKTYFDTLYELAGAIATHAALTVTHGATGAIVGTTNTQTLTNKTLTTPTIADFTNAQHDHGDADDGGAIANNAVLTAMIADAQVTLAKMANLAADTIIGRANGAGTGVPTALTATQVIAILQAGLDLRYGQLAAANTWTANNAFNSTATSGSALSVTRNLAAASTDAPVVYIHQDHASDDQAAAIIENDAAGIGAQLISGAIPALIDRKTTATTLMRSATVLRAISTGSAADGFGPGFFFVLNDAETGDSTSNTIGQIGALRSGADNSGDVAILAVNAGAAVEVVRALKEGKLAVGLSSVGASILGVKAGTSTNDAAGGGDLLTSTTQTGNVTTGEDVIFTYTIPANSLSANGMSVHFEIYGTVAGNGNSKTFKVYFGAAGTRTVLTKQTVQGSAVAGSFVIRGRVTRTGAATQKSICSIMIQGSGSDSDVEFHSDLDQTLSSAVVFSVTAEATATNDVVCEGGVVGWADANS